MSRRRQEGTETGSATRRSVALVPKLLAALAVVAVPARAAAQETGSPAPCDDLGAPYHASCVETALGLRAARAAIGLAAAGGADLSGTNSTLGKRLGSMPRIAVSLRAGAVRAPVTVAGSVPAQADRAWLASLRGDVAVGVFDGFSVAPTVGGILSADLLASAAVVTTSEGDGFAGETLTGAGIGVRVGVFRESFTLPGVTLTATRRWMGETTVGTFGEQGAEGAQFDNTVTSLRGVVGKEFFAVGVLAGAGWDRYRGDATIQVSPPSTPGRTVDADDFEADRMVVFGGVSWNFLVLQLAGEAGWAAGFDAVPGRTEGAFDPEDGTFFGSVSFRLVF